MAMSFSEEVRAILGSDAPTVTDVPALLEAKNGTQEQRIADAKAYYDQPFRKQEEIRQATLDEILKKEAEAKAAADEAARLKAQAGMLTGSSSSDFDLSGGRNYYAELEAQYGPDYARAVQVMNNSRLNDALTTIVGKTFGLGMLVPTQEPAPVRNAVAGVPGVVTIAPVRDAIGVPSGFPVPAPAPVVVTPVAPQPTVVGTPLPPLSSGSSSGGGMGGGTGMTAETYGGSIAGIDGGYSGVY